MARAELEAVVMPDGTIQLEWIGSLERQSNATHLLQNTIFEHYSVDSDNWLLSLGFCQKGPHLSASLEFWRTFVSLFTEKLRPDPGNRTAARAGHPSIKNKAQGIYVQA